MKKLITTILACAIAISTTVVYKDAMYKQTRIDGATKIIEKEFLMDMSFLDVTNTKFTRSGEFDHYTVYGFQKITDKVGVPVMFDCAIDNRIRKIHCFREVE